MKIPKQLTGEVKRFIDSSFYIEYAGFYNQPFKPEMITGYFEGWEIFIETEYRKDGLIISTGNNNGDYDYYGYGKFGMYVFPVPKTLNDFITNCLQAGITLRWKEE